MAFGNDSVLPTEQTLQSTSKTVTDGCSLKYFFQLTRFLQDCNSAKY